MLLNLNMIKPNTLKSGVVFLFQDVVKFEYDKTNCNNVFRRRVFQDVVKFEYDKTLELN